MTRSKAIRINLLQHDNEGIPKHVIMIMACLVVALLGAATGYYVMSSNKDLAALRKENTELQTRFANYKVEQTGIKNMQSLLEERRKVTEQAQQADISCVMIMGEIEKSIPRGMTTVHMEINKDKILINGFAPDFYDVARFISGLRQSSLFENVQITSTKVDEDTKEVEFSVETGWGVNKK